jgi:transcriptional regulator with XRE-family HTH domain
LDSDEAAAELGRRLRARRILLGRTIASVALQAGLSVPYVANLENGRGNPTLSAVRRLAAALGLALRDLLDSHAPAAAPAPAVPEGLRRFCERQRFRDEVRWLAAQTGEDEGELGARILGTMRAMPTPAHRQLDASDWQRLLDALMLTLLPRP